MEAKFGFKNRVNSASSIGRVEYSITTDHGLLTTVFDPSNGISVVSSIPIFETNHEPYSGPYNLIAVNDSPVRIVGVESAKIDLNKERCYPRTFKVADISYAILGSDFLSFYRLKVDSSCDRLLESQKCAESQSHAQINSNFRPTKSVQQTFTIQVAKTANRHQN